jgi:hypothetical protein
MRNHLIRTTRFVHQQGAQVMYHNQNQFNPMIHSAADFWFPGENLHDDLIVHGAFAYADHLGENIYRTELNGDVLGPAVQFLPDLLRVLSLAPKSWSKEKVRSYSSREATESLLGQLLVNGVPCSNRWVVRNVYTHVYNILEEYRIDKASFHPFFKQAESLASNPNVRLSYYRCADGRFLIIAATRSQNEEKTTIQIDRLKSDVASVRDEYNRKDLPVNAGLVEITIKPRNFVLLGF